MSTPRWRSPPTSGSTRDPAGGRRRGVLPHRRGGTGQRRTASGATDVTLRARLGTGELRPRGDRRRFGPHRDTGAPPASACRRCGSAPRRSAARSRSQRSGRHRGPGPTAPGGAPDDPRGPGRRPSALPRRGAGGAGGRGRPRDRRRGRRRRVGRRLGRRAGTGRGADGPQPAGPVGRRGDHAHPPQGSRDPGADDDDERRRRRGGRGDARRRAGVRREGGRAGRPAAGDPHGGRRGSGLQPGRGRPARAVLHGSAEEAGRRSPS